MRNQDIRERLTKLGMKQIELIEIIRTRGYKRLSTSTFSAYVNGYTLGPQSEVVLRIAREILTEQEKIRKKIAN